MRKSFVKQMLTIMICLTIFSENIGLTEAFANESTSIRNNVSEEESISSETTDANTFDYSSMPNSCILESLLTDRRFVVASLTGDGFSSNNPYAEAYGVPQENYLYKDVIDQYMNDTAFRIGVDVYAGITNIDDAAEELIDGGKKFFEVIGSGEYLNLKQSLESKKYETFLNIALKQNYVSNYAGDLNKEKASLNEINIYDKTAKSIKDSLRTQEDILSFVGDIDNVYQTYYVNNVLPDSAMIMNQYTSRLNNLLKMDGLSSNLLFDIVDSRIQVAPRLLYSNDDINQWRDSVDLRIIGSGYEKTLGAIDRGLDITYSPEEMLLNEELINSIDSLDGVLYRVRECAAKNNEPTVCNAIDTYRDILKKDRITENVAEAKLKEVAPKVDEAYRNYLWKNFDETVLSEKNYYPTLSGDLTEMSVSQKISSLSSVINITTAIGDWATNFSDTCAKVHEMCYLDVIRQYAIAAYYADKNAYIEMNTENSIQKETLAENALNDLYFIKALTLRENELAFRMSYGQADSVFGRIIGKKWGVDAKEIWTDMYNRSQGALVDTLICPLQNEPLILSDGTLTIHQDDTGCYGVFERSDGRKYTVSEFQYRIMNGIHVTGFGTNLYIENSSETPLFIHHITFDTHQSLKYSGKVSVGYIDSDGWWLSICQIGSGKLELFQVQRGQYWKIYDAEVEFKKSLYITKGSIYVNNSHIIVDGNLFARCENNPDGSMKYYSNVAGYWYIEASYAIVMDDEDGVFEVKGDSFFSTNYGEYNDGYYPCRFEKGVFRIGNSFQSLQIDNGSPWTADKEFVFECMCDTTIRTVVYDVNFINFTNLKTNDYMISIPKGSSGFDIGQIYGKLKIYAEDVANICIGRSSEKLSVSNNTIDVYGNAHIGIRECCNCKINMYDNSILSSGTSNSSIYSLHGIVGLDISSGNNNTIVSDADIEYLTLNNFNGSRVDGPYFSGNKVEINGDILDGLEVRKQKDFQAIIKGSVYDEDKICAGNSGIIETCLDIYGDSLLVVKGDFVGKYLKAYDDSVINIYGNIISGEDCKYWKNVTKIGGGEYRFADNNIMYIENEDALLNINGNSIENISDKPVTVSIVWLESDDNKNNTRNKYAGLSLVGNWEIKRSLDCAIDVWGEIALKDINSIHSSICVSEFGVLDIEGEISDSSGNAFKITNYGETKCKSNFIMNEYMLFYNYNDEAKLDVQKNLIVNLPDNSNYDGLSRGNIRIQGDINIIQKYQNLSDGLSYGGKIVYQGYTQIIRNPYKMVYKEGEIFDPEGLIWIDHATGNEITEISYPKEPLTNENFPLKLSGRSDGKLIEIEIPIKQYEKCSSSTELESFEMDGTYGIVNDDVVYCVKMPSSFFLRKTHDGKYHEYVSLTGYDHENGSFSTSGPYQGMSLLIKCKNKEAKIENIRQTSYSAPITFEFSVIAENQRDKKDYVVTVKKAEDGEEYNKFVDEYKIYKAGLIDYSSAVKSAALESGMDSAGCKEIFGEKKYNDVMVSLKEVEFPIAGSKENPDGRDGKYTLHFDGNLLEADKEYVLDGDYFYQLTYDEFRMSILQLVEECEPDTYYYNADGMSGNEIFEAADVYISKLNSNLDKYIKYPYNNQKHIRIFAWPDGSYHDYSYDEMNEERALGKMTIKFQANMDGLNRGVVFDRTIPFYENRASTGETSTENDNPNPISEVVSTPTDNQTTNTSIGTESQRDSESHDTFSGDGKVDAPEETVFKYVKNNKKKTLISKWEINSGADGYEIQYALDKKFKKSAKTKTIKSAKKTTLTIKKLKKGKTYFVRVRAYALDGKKKVYGKWSKTKKIKIKK